LTNLDIIHVTQPTSGGVGNYVIELAGYQRGLGLNVAVISPADQPFRERLRALGVRHQPWKVERANGPQLISEYLSLRRALSALDLDSETAVHLHSSKAGLLGRLLVRSKHGTIFQPHGWSFFAARGVERRLALLWERIGSRWADATICVSEGERQIAEPRLQSRLIVIPNGVVAPKRPPSDKERQQLRQSLGIQDVPTVVCVGRLTKAKGQDILVESWAEIRRHVPEARLYLVGGGRPDDVSSGPTDSSIRFVGHSDEVHRWLIASDLVVAPSRWEGMSLSVLEAMAAGRSVVASTAPGMEEMLLGGDEPCGAVVDLKHMEVFSSEMVRRLQSPELARQEGCAGWDRARSHYRLERSLQRLGEAALAAGSKRQGPRVPRAAHRSDVRGGRG
jgi:glycosyltransferase involved in cell wall biosynthesis